MQTRDPAAYFARTLAQMPEADRPDHFASAVIEGGGTYAVPGTGTGTGPETGFVVLQLHGISGTGRSEGEAIVAWIRAADPEGTAA